MDRGILQASRMGNMTVGACRPPKGTKCSCGLNHANTAKTCPWCGVHHHGRRAECLDCGPLGPGVAVMATRAECGSQKGYDGHLRRGEPTCQECRDANNERNRRNRQKKERQDE